MSRLLAANWKMHLAPAGSEAPDSPYRSKPGVDVVVFPSFVDIGKCVWFKLVTGAQWGCAEENGGRTGDVSMKMIKDIGCTYVLCGHSERRINHGETDADVAAQIKAALEQGLIPIVCVGESEQEKAAGKIHDVLAAQLSGLPSGELIIAYEPVWAIGSGKTPGPEDIADAAKVILEKRPNAKILYGGSLDDKNCKEILSIQGIHGALIGGASLKPDVFGKIVECAMSL